MIRLSALTVFFTLFVFILFQAPFVDAAPPAGFTKNALVTTGLSYPDGLGIAPDGRVFILEQGGIVKIYKNGALLPTPFATFPAETFGDRGLLGITFDPDFLTNNYVYFYYADKDTANYIVRLDASGDVSSGTPVILYSTPKPSGQYHNGGTIQFGPDGKLYLSLGELGYGPNAQDLSVPFGKILRFNPDGSIPSDNPFVGQAGKLPEIWAYGLRNPFRFQFDSTTGDLYAGDVGKNSWEEVNKIVKAGNYGWPIVEGNCGANCAYINPIYAYPQINFESTAVVGGPMYRASLFPSEYRGTYFFGDYARGFIKRLIFDSANTPTVEDFDLEAGGVTDMKVAPDGSIYYVTIFPGALYQISYSTTNQIPIAVSSADISSGEVPLSVHFSSQGSSDPDGSALTYTWDFGDGTSSTEANPVKVFDKKGKFGVKLTVSDGTTPVHASLLSISVGTPPTLTISLPDPAVHYQAGQSIQYASTAQDSAGAAIQDSSFDTEVIFHHGTHIHPFVLFSDSRTGSFTIPQTGEGSPDTWYEVKVTATDANGLTSQKNILIHPQKSTLSVTTVPAGLSVSVDGTPLVAPQTIESVVGFKREFDAPIQKLGDTYYQFDHWSDSGEQKHFVETPESGGTYTATFRVLPPFAAEYFNNTTLTGEPSLTRNDQFVDFDWPDGSPDPTIHSDNFSARWTRSQYFQAGNYTFTTITDDGVRLYIDGQILIDRWFGQGPEPHSASIDLPSGDHSIKMEYFEGGGSAAAHLSWVRKNAPPTSSPTPTPAPTASPTPTISPTPTPSPGPSTGSFKGEYFDNTTLSGEPVFTRQDKSIDFSWADASPDVKVPTDNFSARWTKSTHFENGIYTFHLRGDDGIRLSIDDRVMLDQWKDQPPTDYTIDAQISEGEHTIKLEYFEHFGGAFVEFDMKKSTGYSGKFWNLPDSPFPPTVPNRAPDLELSDTLVNSDWGEGSPESMIQTDKFLARWQRQSLFDSGNYLFTVTTDDGMRIFIDDTKVFDQWKDQPPQTYTFSVPITQGLHTVRVEYFEHFGGAVARLSYTKSDVGNTPFSVQYFDNMNVSGTPVVTRTQATLSTDWGDGSPDISLPPDQFSLRATKTLTLPEGTYAFSLISDDGIRFLVDGTAIVDDWHDHSAKQYSPTVHLNAGSHTFVLEYFENYGNATLLFQ